MSGTLISILLLGRLALAGPSTALTIHPNGNRNKCLDVRGAVLGNGTLVEINDCNRSNVKAWTFNSGNTQMSLVNTPYCLDAGPDPKNNTHVKIWQCLNNLPGQSWYYTVDKRLALTCKGQCLDLTDGVLSDRNLVQIYQCTDFNTNQIWTV